MVNWQNVDAEKIYIAMVMTMWSPNIRPEQKMFAVLWLIIKSVITIIIMSILYDSMGVSYNRGYYFG